MNVYIYVNIQKPNALNVAIDAGKVLKKHGADIIFDTTCASLEHEFTNISVLPAQKAFKKCDIVLCIGGDGSILHAARHAIPYNKPLLGINVGRLGFLAALESDELESLKKIPLGDYSVEYRSVLQANILGDEKNACFALNDVVLFKTAPEKTITLEIFCDDVLVSHFRGDGVIFATPTGSTAYSMSAGGPILDSRLDGMVITQICAHIVRTPPLVFSLSRIIRVHHTGENDEQACISCDGAYTTPLQAAQWVEIKKSSLKVPLIQLSATNQLEAIDKKLRGR
jgi:NAD+ kinase